MTNLLVELQTEELPPKALKSLSNAFAEGVRKSLADQHFLAEGAEVAAYGSPRRLAVHITNVLDKSPEEAYSQKLVPVRVGLDAEGKPTAALTKKWPRSALPATLPLSSVCRTAKMNSLCTKV